MRPCHLPPRNLLMACYGSMDLELESILSISLPSHMMWMKVWRRKKECYLRRTNDVRYCFQIDGIAAFPDGLAGHICCSGTAAGMCGNLWRHFLFCKLANTRTRHPHGVGRTEGRSTKINRWPKAQAGVDWHGHRCRRSTCTHTLSFDPSLRREADRSARVRRSLADSNRFTVPHPYDPPRPFLSSTSSGGAANVLLSSPRRKFFSVHFATSTCAPPFGESLPVPRTCLRFRMG